MNNDAMAKANAKSAGMQISGNLFVDVPLGNTPEQQQVRLQCLELASRGMSSRSKDDVMSLAAEMVEFVEAR